MTGGPDTAPPALRRIGFAAEPGPLAGHEDAGADDLRLHWSTIFFCIKEAAYKALGASDPAFFEFDDVEVRLTGARGPRFTASVRGPHASTVHGRFRVAGRHIIAIAVAGAVAAPAGAGALPAAAL